MIRILTRKLIIKKLKFKEAMYRFNQLEKLLDSIVNGKEGDDDDPNLVFDLGDYLLIFSRDEGSYIGYLNCVAHDNYDRTSVNYRQNFEFELPLIHINHFLLKHIDVNKRDTHFLLSFPSSYDIVSIEDVYNTLVEKIHAEPKFFPAFLPGVLNKELPINSPGNTKKIKL